MDSNPTMTLVERAARAMCDYYCEDPDAIDDVPGLDHKRLARWRRYAPVAAAVLEAIKEPTQGMQEAGFKNGASEYSYDCWRAMIDAALAEA